MVFLDSVAVLVGVVTNQKGVWQMITKKKMWRIWYCMLCDRWNVEESRVEFTKGYRSTDEYAAAMENNNFFRTRKLAQDECDRRNKT